VRIWRMHMGEGELGRTEVAFFLETDVKLLRRVTPCPFRTPTGAELPKANSSCEEASCALARCAWGV